MGGRVFGKHAQNLSNYCFSQNGERIVYIRCACVLGHNLLLCAGAPHITPSCPVPKIWTAPQWRDDDGSFFPQYTAGSVGSMADQRGAALKAAILLNSPNVATHSPMPPFDIAVAMTQAALYGELVWARLSSARHGSFLPARFGTAGSAPVNCARLGSARAPPGSAGSA